MREEDLHLLRVDPGVPGLRLLLDDEELSGWAAGHGVPVPARRSYLRWKPGSGGVAALTSPRGRSDGDVFLAVWHRQAAPKFAKVQQRLGAHVLLADESRLALVASARADRDLPALHELLDADGPGRALGGLRPHASAVTGTSLTGMSYKPRRRWVGRLDTADGAAAAVLRAYRPSDLDDALTRWSGVRQVLGSGPRVLGRDRRRGLLALEHVPGAPLDRLLGSAQAGAVQVRAAGSTLARLHTADPGPLRIRQGRTDAAAFRSSVELLRRLRPHRTDLTTLAATVLEQLPPPGSPKVLVHGDFSADQVVLADDGSMVLLDLDEAGVGDPASDLAGAAADWLTSAAGTSAGPGQLVDWLHEGYVDGAALPAAEQLRACTAAHLVRRAVAPFRAGRHDWPQQVDSVLDLAGDVLHASVLRQ